MFDLFVRTFSDWRVARDTAAPVERRTEQPPRDPMALRRDAAPRPEAAGRKTG